MGEPAAPPANEKKRGRKPGTVAKKRDDIPLDEFNISKLDATDRVKHKRRREERSEQQVAVDDLVASIYEEWVEEGMPTNWADMPVHTWEVSKTHAETAMFLIRKACTLYGRKPVFGQIEDFEHDGRPWVIIPYCIIARPPKKPRPA